MRIDEERSRIAGSRARVRVHTAGLLDKVMTFAVGAVLLVVAFMLSVLVLASVVMTGLLVLGYLWWKTKGLRKQMREQPPGGCVIEGEVIHEIHDVGSHDQDQR